MKFLLWVGILCGVNANAGSVSESFETTARKEASTLVWNIAMGQLHPTMIISNAQTTAAVNFNYNLDFGDGRHGAFDSTTYQNFDSVPATASVVDLNTDTYTSLQVTNFRLPAGITLRPVGSNPLIIRSLSDVLIEGTASINCSGENGEDVKQPKTSTSTGGTGHCGGGRGGDGGRHTGVVAVNAERGYPQSGATNPIGGAGGAAEFGGGGGGSMYNGSPAGNAYDNTGTIILNSGGGNSNDQQFTQFIGSAGGGGGGVSDNGAGTDSTGSGGGAGGGSVFIFAYQDFTNQGTVNVRGGNGGAAIGGANGGLGGGGGGGTVVLIAGRSYVNDGPVQSNPGSGGTRVGDIGEGGSGAEARVWYTDNDGTLGGSTAEEKNNFLNNYSDSDYTTGTLEATTLPIDLSNTRPTITGVVMNSTVQGGGTLTVSVAGSKDGFAGDDTGWQPVASLSSFSKKRYLKFRFQINNASVSLPTLVDGVTVNYTETTQEEFIFGAACGRTSSPAAPTLWKFLLELLSLLVPYFVIKLYQLRPKINFGRA